MRTAACGVVGEYLRACVAGFVRGREAMCKGCEAYPWSVKSVLSAGSLSSRIDRLKRAGIDAYGTARNWTTLSGCMIPVMGPSSGWWNVNVDFLLSLEAIFLTGSVAMLRLGVYVGWCIVQGAVLQRTSNLSLVYGQFIRAGLP